MLQGSVRRALVLVCALAVVLAAAPAALASQAPARPVPSLTPKATQKLWRALIRRPHRFSAQLAPNCRPLRAVFYASTDWLRLATRLAANPSPCAQYYVSIPPLAADKTAFRYDQPWRIRALGPQFHVLAEMNWTGWTGYVNSTGSTWYAAGQEARRRMEANGFDVSLGDTWIVNELSSAVRAGTGNARINVREFVRGLHDGNGAVPLKGAVFISGIAQSTVDVSTYKVNIQNWYQDTPFWQDMSAYVTDWSQELYGDVRDYAVAGASPAARRDSLNEYLKHEVALANAAPASAAAAAAFVRAAYSPLANAAWKWDAAYGWTSVPVAQMEDYVSAQTYALRNYGASSGQAQDHFGFAWSPKNLDGMPMADYDTQTNALLDRLAAAIHDSGVPSADPGAAACGPSWCSAVVSGAAFTPAWQTFSTWSPPAVGFASAPVTLTAGTVAAGLSVRLQTAGIPQTDPAPVTVTLSSNSAAGLFAPGPDGPWTGTLDVTIPAGSTSAAFAYEDTTAGAPTLTATAAARQSGTQSETVVAGALATLSLSPGSTTLALGGSQAFTAAGADAYGNPVAAAPAWSVSAGTPGTVAPSSGATTTFTASSTAPGSGSVVATQGSVSASAAVSVTGPRLRISSIAYAQPSSRLAVTFTVLDAATGKPVRSASVAFRVLHGSAVYASGTVVTGAGGQATYKTATVLPKGCYSTAVGSVSAARYAWDGVTPVNQICK